MRSREARCGSPSFERSALRGRASSIAREASESLAAANVPEPEASAEVLLSELLGVRRSELAFHEVSGEELRVYSSYISRRKEREPVQRILGHAYFRDLTLDLDEHTLIPRSDTESVVGAALERIDARGYPCRVLDLGTGSGAIAISIARERPRCEVHASDASEAALRTTERNAQKNEAKVELHLADVAAGLERLSESLDLLVSNPPYIETEAIEVLEPEVRDWDPPLALDGGPDGLRFFRRIFEEVPRLLKAGADVVLEVGDGQAEAVLGLGRSAGFVPLGSREDLVGSPRAVLFRWPG